MFENTPPLAERMRPSRIENLVGQEHLLGENAILRKIITSQNIPSFIIWGPPGVGKTTIAYVISQSIKARFYSISAVSSGVKDLREILEKALGYSKTILFIDEIHRFNKGQQDALLHAVEKGTIILIGATTENPSFEINSALLSRMQVFVFKPLEEKHLKKIIDTAITEDEMLKKKNIILEETEALYRFSSGDGRKLLNLLELVSENIEGNPLIVTNEKVMSIVQDTIALYDKKGEQHYDIISAFIKSIRGSDPNAALYYLARMLKGGEDLKFIARRMLIVASEDIGNANPNALLIAHSTFESVNIIGYPEARIILSQCVIYLASSPKSNSSYTAINKAMEMVENTGDLSLPLHIRNAPTFLMKKMNYGKNYKYAHDFENNFVEQEFLPDAIKGSVFYEPGNNAREEEMRKHLRKLWKDKYGY